jgi:hypothetical protein
MQPLLVAAALLSLGMQAAAYQTAVAAPSRKSALARRGLHHANISGRFIDGAGRPVPGVRVQIDTGLPRELPAAEAVSDAAGRFRFADLSTTTTPGIRWFPPERWMPEALTVAGESFADIGFGDIRLSANTIVRVALELVGGPPLGGRSHISVVIAGSQSQPRIVGRESNGIYTLTNIPFREGKWDISVGGQGRSESYSAPVVLEEGQRDQFFVVRLMRDTAKKRSSSDYSYEGQMEAFPSFSPEQPSLKTLSARGRVLAPDGSPMAGVLASTSGFFLDPTAARWTFTDAGGRFELEYSDYGCREPLFSYGESETWSSLERADFEIPCDKRWAAAKDVTIPSATKLILKPSGIEPEPTVARWWHPALGWRPFGTLQPWVSLRAWRNQPVVALAAEGHMPVVRRLALPDVNAAKGEKPPPNTEADFPFDFSTPRVLRVSSRGTPVRGATVDLELILDLASDKRVPIGTYRTDSNGRLALSGEADREIEAFVHAAGYGPARLIWRTGIQARVDLSPRTARLTLPSMRPGYVARIWRVGEIGGVRTVRADHGKVPEAMLEAGSHDVLLYGDNGQVRGYRRVELKAGEVRGLDFQVDERPRLIVRYPEDGWTAAVSDSTPGGMPVGWAISSTFGRQFTIQDVPAVLERETPSESVFRISRSGRFHVQVSRTNPDQTWWREVDLSPGAVITLDVPKGNATLRGSMRTYDGGVGFSHHGWAGPRMQLIADRPDGWSVTVFMPTRDGKDTFTLSGLPSGSYSVHQHLIGTQKTYRGEPGKEESYTVPLDAWGGIPVVLSDGVAAVLNDFIEYPFRACAVKVTYADGSPVDGAVLRVRDRMSDSWRRVAEAPTTLANASHPIPYPPAARVVRGAASLPAIRAGRLQLLLEMDDGTVIPIDTDVDPAAGLTVRLPSSGGSR